MTVTAASRSTGPGPRALLEVQDLTKVYRSGEVEVYALRGATATLYEGEVSVLLGPSGSGKSTFLNILGGLDTPTSGRILFEGDDLSGMPERECRDICIVAIFEVFNRFIHVWCSQSLWIIVNLVSILAFCITEQKKQSQQWPNFSRSWLVFSAFPSTVLSMNHH